MGKEILMKCKNKLSKIREKLNMELYKKMMLSKIYKHGIDLLWQGECKNPF
jgi:hypothetical protein